MTLERRLANHVLDRYPDRAATVLERQGEEATVRVLERDGTTAAATIIQHLSPQFSVAVLQGLTPERAVQIVDSLPVDTAARFIRRAEGSSQEAILSRLQPKQAQRVRAVLGFREGTAGSLMDPDVLALPQELTAREALQRVRAAAEYARYNLYVVNQQQCLVGAINLRELLLARGRVPLCDLMIRNLHHVLATADRTSLLSHPGWKSVHALPVVDQEGIYLGAIRYRTLRALEEEFLAPRSQDLDSGAAFAEVVAAGARGVLGAISGAEAGQGRDYGA